MRNHHILVTSTLYSNWLHYNVQRLTLEKRVTYATLLYIYKAGKECIEECLLVNYYRVHAQSIDRRLLVIVGTSDIGVGRQDIGVAEDVRYINMKLVKKKEKSK